MKNSVVNQQVLRAPLFRTAFLISCLAFMLLLLPMPGRTAKAAEIVESGTCGENLTWTLDDEGVLIISGEGEMTDYNSEDNRSPWAWSYIKTVVVNAGVRNIGNYAFLSCSYLSNLTIPCSITSIGESAFTGCSGLTSLTIPNSVTSIGDYAFSDCSGLTNLTIPKSVKKIGNGAFRSCTALTTINYNAVCANHPLSYSDTFLNSGSSSTGMQVIIGDGVEVIPRYLFYEVSTITNLTFADSTTDVFIGNYAFSNCVGLTDLTIGNSNPSTERYDFSSYYSFSGCTNLVRLSLTDTCISFPYELCNGIGSLQEIVVDENNEVFTSEAGIAYNKTKKAVVKCPKGYSQTVNLPESVKMISKEAFAGCGIIEELIIPRKVDSIESGAFKESFNLKRITFLGDLPSFGENCFYRIGCKGYYPYGNTSWDERPIIQGVTWIPYSQGTLIDLTLISKPDKTVYEIGEEIDLAGLSFVARYTDGLVWTNSSEDLEMVEYDFSSCGKKEVIAHYDGSTFSFNVNVYEVRSILIDASEYPESEHPYPNGVEETYSYQYPYAFKLELTFSEDTQFEAMTDYLYVMDAAGTIIGTYTGRELSGKTIEVSGDTVQVRLVSDEDSAQYGFSLTSIVAYYREGLCEGGHTGSLVKTNAKAPTCTETGNIEYWTCSVCDRIFSDEEGKNEITLEDTVIAALGHDWKSPVYIWADNNKSVTAVQTCAHDQNHVETETVSANYAVITEPTCEEFGTGLWTSKPFVNEAFEIQTKEVLISALGHMFVKTEAKAPTCTTAGNIEYWACSVCGKIFSDAEGNNEITIEETVIAALGHDWRAPVYTWAENNKSVTAAHVCNNDETHIETETVAAAYSIKTPAACEADGVGLWTSAEFEKDAFTVQTKEVPIPATGHNWSEPSYFWAEDNASLTATRSCLNDASHIETEIVETVFTVKKAPTCEKSGTGIWISLKFSNRAFGIQTKEEEIPATGHTLVKTEAKLATCITAGNIEYWTCKVCGKIFSDAEGKTEITQDETVIAALSHDYHDVVTAPTCTEQGFTTHTCSRCGDLFIDAYVAALGHDWDAPSYTWAEDNKSVTAKHVCKRDGTHIETETVAASYSVKMPASCKEEGVGVWTSAEFKNEAFTVQTKEVAIRATGHNWGEPVYTWAENNESVTAKRTCLNDETHIERETVEASFAVKQAATCERSGVGIWISPRFANKVFEIQVKEVEIPATGHDWSDPVIVWEEGGYTATASRSCKNDQSHTDSLEVNVTSEVKAEPDCETTGIRVYTASVVVDGITFTSTKEEVLAKKGHVLEKTEAKAATCTAAGNIEYWTCEVCGKIFSDAEGKNEISLKETVVTALGHDYHDMVTAPTCTEQGFTTHTCSQCGDIFIDAYVAALGHDWDAPSYTWAEDNKSVTAKRICLNDNAHVETETVNAFYAVRQNATCEENGAGIWISERFTNKAFEIQIKEVVIPAIGHDWSAPVWTWNGHESATATFVCKNDPTHKETVAAVITSEIAGNKTTYTATVVLQGETYTDSKTEEIPWESFTWTRLGGSNRYTTMQLIVREAFPEAGSCKTIIVAVGNNWKTGLMAAGLAGALDAPFITVPVKASQTANIAPALEEIERLAASDCEVLLLGPGREADDTVLKAIKKTVANVRRVTADSAEALGLALYEEGRGKWNTSGTVILASGTSFADSLSISPYAYAAKTPIFYTNEDKGLRDEDMAIMTSGDVSRVIIVGGIGSVSEAAEASLKAANLEVIRLAGDNRYLTSAAIVKWGIGQDAEAAFQPDVLLTVNNMGVAKGNGLSAYADALTCVDVLGTKGGALLLVADDSKKNKETTMANIAEIIEANKILMRKAYIFGGNGSVSAQIEGWLNEAVK